MEEKQIGPTQTDTSDAAAEVQARVFRDMPAWRKVALVDIELGEELAARVYGPMPPSPGR